MSIGCTTCVRPDSSTTTEAHWLLVVYDESSLCGVTSRADSPVESVKHLTRDGSLVTMVDGNNGQPLNVGRKQRTVPPALKRALWSRDEGCSFPGCTHTRFVDAHHIRHRSDSGEASIDNTALLCSSHQRLVHEGGYEIVKDYRGEGFFRRPDGRAIPAPGYRPEDCCDTGVLDKSGDSAETVTHSGVWMHPEVREPSIWLAECGLIPTTSAAACTLSVQAPKPILCD